MARYLKVSLELFKTKRRYLILYLLTIFYKFSKFVDNDKNNEKDVDYKMGEELPPV